MFSLFMRSSIVQLFFTTDFKPRLDRRFEPFPVHVRREIRTSCNRIELHDIPSDIHFQIVFIVLHRIQNGAIDLPSR